MHDSDIVCEVIKHLLKAKPELKKQGKEPQAPKLFETLFKPTKFGNEYTDKRDLLKKKKFKNYYLFPHIKKSELMKNKLY